MSISQLSSPQPPVVDTLGDSSVCWDVLDRGSTAGRALFNLYRGDSNRKLYDQRARARNAQLLAQQKAQQEQRALCNASDTSATKQNTVSRSKAAVAVPRFKRSSAGDSAQKCADAVPRRKPGALIAREIAEQQALDEMAHPPVSTGPLLDEQEKVRCAELMHHRGEVPQVSAEDAARLRRMRQPTAPLSRLDELQQLFSSVHQEVQDREAFTAEMQRCQRPKQEYAHVRLEIADRLQELRRLDTLIAAEQQRSAHAQDAQRDMAG